MLICAIEIVNIKLHHQSLDFQLRQAVGRKYSVEVFFKGTYSCVLKLLDNNSSVQNDYFHTQFPHCLAGGISQALYKIRFGSSSEMPYVREWRRAWLVCELKNSSRLSLRFRRKCTISRKERSLSSKSLFCPSISTQNSFFGS